MNAFQEARLLDLIWQEIQARLGEASEEVRRGMEGVRLLEIRGEEAMLEGRASPEAQAWLRDRIQQFFPSVQRLVWKESPPLETLDATPWEKLAQTPHNRFALRLLQHLAPRKGRPLYNPLVFWGPPGVGKTTLIVVYARVLRGEGVPVLYWTADRFMKDAVEALRAKRLAVWRREVLQHQVIVMENLHEILPRGAFFQSEVLALIEDSRSRVQWIFSAHSHPRRMRKIREDLRSRLLGGLTVHVPAPDTESRRTFVRFLLERRGRELPETLLETLVARSPGDLRVLEGWVNQVLAYYDLQGAWPTWEVLQEDLLLEETTPAHAVLAVVAEVMGVSVDAMLGRSRRLQIALARRVAMYILHEDYHMSLRDVGEVFQRHHTTVLSNLRTLRRQMAQDPRIPQRVARIRELLDGS